MSPIRKARYVVADSVPENAKEVFNGHGTLLSQLLYNRGLIETETIERFLSPNFETDLHDPFLMTDMEKAVERTLTAIKNNERIIIFSDYDCDGIPGGVLMHDFLSAIEHVNFENYIPHRHFEGYGLSVDAVEKLHERGAKLIITVDCGITDVEAVERANELGVDVIITDHHEIGTKLPPAVAVLNPKRDEAYPFRDLCGSGVAFKFIQALMQKGNFDLKEGWEKWWLDVVGIATIADMVPLQGENRALAHYGLEVLRKSKRPGLQHLLRAMRVNQRFLNEDDIGFTIGPRINAASRMDTPEHAFRVLATKDEGDAGEYARELEKLNNERKGAVAAMVKDIKGRMGKMTDISSVIVMGNPAWRPALVGLAANSLADTYKRPAFLWGRDGREIIKGSCRSDGSVSVVELMHEVKDVLKEYGGHHVSGGFAVLDENIHILEERLNSAYEAMRQREGDEDVITVDADLTIDDVLPATVREINSLAPFGEGNKKPLFRFARMTPIKVETFGKGNDHTKIMFVSNQGPREAVAFFKTPDEFNITPEAGKELTLIAHLEQSFFMNRPQVRMRIIDIV